MPKRTHPSEISPSFCMLPWIHLSTRPNGHMRLCCTANASSAGKTNDKVFGGEVGILKTDNGRPANLGQIELDQAWNDEFMRRTRTQMLKGEWPASCLKCKKEEESGTRSKRVWETEYWSARLDLGDLLRTTEEDGRIPGKIRYLDLRLGTKCNLKCIMCSPHDSSSWIPDWEKLHPQIENPALRETMQWPSKGRVDGASYTWHRENPRFWDSLMEQLPNLEQLYFAGGEPLIIDDHYTILEECVKRGEASHIELRYNSNGLVLPEKLFSLWSHFKRVRFHFSLDSIGEMNHYIRYPSPWSRVQENLRKLDETPDSVEVTLACAVQALNIHYLPDLIDWKLAQNFKKINPYPLGAGLVNFHLVYHPAHLNVKILPNWFKDEVENKIEKYCDELVRRPGFAADFAESGYGVKRLRGLVRFMRSEDWSNRVPQFQEYIRRMDEIRKTDFAATFPEMKGILFT